MNRPRPSVLALFDPLTARDAHSPDSDKENTLPDSDFFAQTHVQYYSPVRLTRRLVEVGDVTVEVGEDADEEEDEHAHEHESDDENDTVAIHPPSSPRTPLADVSFDRERTPMRSKMYRRKAAPGETTASESSPPPASVDAATAPSATFGEPPSVVVCPPEDTDTHSSPASDTESLSDSLATLSLATPTGSLIADTTMAFPPTPSEASPLLLPSPHPPQSSGFESTSATTPSFELDDRSSADLQTSFALHMNMNSDDTSFDLLTDRISFRGYADEESFDMGERLGAISEQEDDTGATLLAQSSEQPELTVVPPPSDLAAPNSLSDSALRAASPPVTRLLDILPEPVHQHPCASSTIPLQPLSTSSVPPPVFVAPPSRRTPPLPVLSTRLPEPPALIPALKIVKRKHPETAAVTKSVGAAVAVETEPLEKPDPPTAAKSGPARMAAPVGRYVMEGPGPWRVPISNTEKEKVAVNAKPQPASALSGPRRIPLATQAPAPAAAAPPPPTKALSQIAQGTTATTLGLKRPLRTVPPNGSASGLPRAVGGTGGSRLPMPTKSKIPSAGGTGIPRRRA